LPYVKKPCTQARRINVQRLQTDATLAQVYSLKLQNKFEALGPLTDMDVESTWSVVASAVLEVASSTIGLKRNIRRPWISDSTFNVLEKKAIARGRRLVQESQRLQGIFNTRAKLDREAYYNRLANLAQEGIYQNNLRPAFRAINSLSDRGFPSEPAPVKKTDGSACSSPEEILQRWQEHFESVLNFSPATVCPELVAVASQATTYVSE